MTVGYGHLIKQGEDFSTGLTEEEADKLLSRDLANAVLQVQSLGIDVPSDWNDFLILMTFQLGINGVKNFKKMIAALNEKNYREAVLQAQDSKWNAQTPFRVRDMVSHLINK
ncbi:glycoside hydrolase family protein [Pseudescherichia vulneris]|uniref:glycoside hydrolase family protein n=1 Tax=Pseudescherichia vulneris TaxID=566 RepID=UPI0028AA2CF3|nr:glycoside hydrolase family protein [Pseudescherichia vulneris]